MDPSSSTASSSSSAAAPESRPQAGPLPRKRGEIGYSEEALRQAEEGRSTTPTSTAPLPERHPEDRGSTDSNETAAAPSDPAAASTPSVNTVATNSTSISKRKRILALLKSEKVPSYYGLRLTTLVACACQILFVVGTIVGWYFTISKLGHSSSSSSSNQQGSDSQSQQALGSASSAIFVHVVFGVATLVQLLFIERRVFRLRAQRYSFVHPGQILPSARTRAMGDPTLALSPWNRPPLPTYAAALAQSGVGTGDVEDHLIAAPPPPAYGNTRGSTFLLSGFLRNSLLAQRPVSVNSTVSQNTNPRHMSQRSERPLSYKSVDEDWEEVQNAERARVLEETLARLEQPAPAVTR